jgi:3-oxoacyl-[acyl-carrier-protein] synthase II
VIAPVREPGLWEPRLWEPRLWVTGLGLVTPLGVGVEATWNGLVRGERAIAPITLFDTSGQRANLGAEVPSVTVESAGATRTVVSRTSAMALLAAEEAVRAAKLDVRAHRVGLVVATTTGGMLETERLLASMHADPACRRLHAAMRCHPITATAELLEEKLGPFVRARTIASACSSGANALLVAAAWLRAGEVDAVLAGGADSLCRLTLTGFNALGAVDTGPCRPFDRERKGTTLGEGAGFLVLEAPERARARKATPVAALAGWAAGSEAHHITNPEPGGSLAAGLMARALGRAGLEAADLDYVNAHGTGTPHNDAMEASALACALGPEIARVAVSSSKGQIGHTLGAAGAIEAAITALVVARATLVPTAGLETPDEALRLAHVLRVGRSVPRVRAALSNAFGFGGMDTVLAFTEAREDGPRRASSAIAGAAGGAGAGVDAPVLTGAASFGPEGLLGVAACAEALHAGGTKGTPVDADATLDGDRARRFDRAARMATVAIAHALSEAGAEARGAGIALGTAFGAVDASAAFLHRAFEKGPRLAAPAEFPNLVPSAPVGHASIYLGAHGPSLATSDRGASGESAFFHALDLVRAGESDRFVAGAIDLASDIVDRALGPLFCEGAAQRSDRAAVVVVESERVARARGACILARVARSFEWRGGDADAARAVGGPGRHPAEVILVWATPAAEAFVARTGWADAPRHACAPRLGDGGEALGAVALAVAAARVGAGYARESLFVAHWPDRGYAVVLVAA